MSGRDDNMAVQRNDESGWRTYAETVARGFYLRHVGGTFGKYDNVRTFWEDQVTRFVLRPFIKSRVADAAARGRKLRILDLGCGAGQGYELITRIPASDLSLEEMPRYVLGRDQIELYFGLDLSEAMIEQGRENYRGQEYFRFETGDLREGLGPARKEKPFDVYFSSYGSLSHLDSDALRGCLRSVAEHAEPGAIVVLDLVGRYSPEWPGYWSSKDDVLPYSMSYLYQEEERRSQKVEIFPLRFWTGEGIVSLCEETASWPARLKPVEIVDRSVFVGRHLDTNEYGAVLPPLRSGVNSLYEQNRRTNLKRLHAEYRPVPGADRLNALYSELSTSWNTLIDFTTARIAGERVDLVGMPGWRDFPAALQMALFTVDRIVDSVAWMDVGDVRANVIEPQLAYVLRRMEHRLQAGIGSGHGMVVVLEVQPRGK